MATLTHSSIGTTTSSITRWLAPRSLGERMVVAARDRIYADLMRCCRPGPDDTILDVGVSDVVNDAANVLERKYPHQDRITAVGLGTGTAFRTSYPKAAYRQIEANRPLPFADHAFEVRGVQCGPRTRRQPLGSGRLRARPDAGRQKGLHQRAQSVLSGRAPHRDPAAALLEAKLRRGLPDGSARRNGRTSGS